ncbi:MAG: NYN domain-containing protein [Candidatus Aenigmatarchaeota archaeon]
MVLDRVRGKSSKKDQARVGLFVDGPNILRKQFEVNLDELREKVSEYGRITNAKVFLNQFASEKLIEAVASQGFEPVISLGGEQEEEGRSDIDVSMAVNTIEALEHGLEVMVLVTRDADFLPVIQKAKREGAQVVVMGMNPGFSTALKNAADEVLDLEEFMSK